MRGGGLCGDFLPLNHIALLIHTMVANWLYVIHITTQGLNIWDDFSVEG